MFIDTLAFLLTRKRVDKRKKKKDIHLSTTTKEKLLQRMIHLVLYYARVFLFLLLVFKNNDEDEDVVVKQSIVPIEFHKACGWRRRSLLHIVPIVTREHPSIPKKTNSEKINCCYCCYYANEKATSFAFSLAAKYELYCLLMCV